MKERIRVYTGVAKQMGLRSKSMGGLRLRRSAYPPHTSRRGGTHLGLIVVVERAQLHEDVERKALALSAGVREQLPEYDPSPAAFSTAWPCDDDPGKRGGKLLGPCGPPRSTRAAPGPRRSLEIVPFRR